MNVLALDADGPVSRVSKWQTNGVVALFIDASLESVVVEDLERAVLVADSVQTEWIKSATTINQSLIIINGCSKRAAVLHINRFNFCPVLRN